jgi:hypothetical protein
MKYCSVRSQKLRHEGLVTEWGTGVAEGCNSGFLFSVVPGYFDGAAGVLKKA